MSAFYDEKKTRLLIPSPSCPDDLNALPPSPSCSQGYNGRDPSWASHLFPDDPILLGITMRHDDERRLRIVLAFLLRPSVSHPISPFRVFKNRIRP